MAITFDGEALLITLPAGQAAVDAQGELYSAWKEWLKAGTNARYAPAFDTVGGDPISGAQTVAPYFFLRNDLGWRIRPAEEDANVTITGNLYARDGDLPLFVPAIGDYTVLVTVDRSASALVVATGSGVTEQDKLDIADRVLDEVLSGHATSGTMGRAVSDIKGKTDALPSGIQKNVALPKFSFLMVSSTDHITPKTGLTVTAQRSLDGGAFAACANGPVEVGNGVYALDLAASDLNGDVVTLKFTASGADQRTVTIVTEP